MTIDDIRNLNRSIEEKKRKKAENSALNLKLEKEEFGQKALETKQNRAKIQEKKNEKNIHFLKFRYAAIIFICLLCQLLAVCSLFGVFQPSRTNLNPVVSIDNMTSEAEELKLACDEILTTFRENGNECVETYMKGFPPEIVKKAVNKLSNVSKYDGIYNVDIKKDARMDCYHINCSWGADSKSITLSLMKNPGGKFRLIGIN